MRKGASTIQYRDGDLWALALGLSLILNVSFFVLLGFSYIDPTILRNRPLFKPEIPSERIITIMPDVSAEKKSAAAIAAQPESAPNRPRFSRTAEDQALAKPERPDFIGERDTQVTSSRVPFRDAPPLPSQSGVQPRNPDHIETVQNDYQDGTLGGPASTPPTPIVPEQAVPPPPPPPPPLAAPPLEPNLTTEPPKPEGLTEAKPTAPAQPVALEGSFPVDVPTPKNSAEPGEIKPSAPTATRDVEKTAASEKTLPKPPKTRSDVTAPGFRGNQKKTAIIGSISRTGRSALNVADSPLGRYQAIISRAVELEWQRNCIRHRDLITPGFLTVRFFVENSGRVKLVQFVGDMETGVAQKGFTLNAIRDAEIPEMPASIKKEYASEPLEIIFNFYF
jgi:hypothetical protein